MVLLGAVALGLAGFAAWRIMMAVRDPERASSQGNATLRRLGYLASGIANLALAVAAASMVLPTLFSSGGGDDTQGWTARLMAQPYGPWLVMGVGLVVIAVAIAFAVRAFRATFERHLDREACRPAIRNLCRIGILARALVFAIIGGFLVVAGWSTDPSEAKGFAEALDSLAAQPQGEALLGAVGLGLVLFAFYSLVSARYRRINTRA
jgi:amino acid transporter